eukprot:360380-Chlamydomonas_euryale.AAC.4
MRGRGRGGGGGRRRTANPRHVVLLAARDAGRPSAPAVRSFAWHPGRPLQKDHSPSWPHPSFPPAPTAAPANMASLFPEVPRSAASLFPAVPRSAASRHTQHPQPVRRMRAPPPRPPEPSAAGCAHRARQARWRRGAGAHLCLSAGNHALAPS